LRASVSLFNGAEAQFKFFSSYVFYCGASKTLNLCIVRGENPPVYFNLKCARSVREENHSCSRLRCVNIISSLQNVFFLPLAISLFLNDNEADQPAFWQRDWPPSASLSLANLGPVSLPPANLSPACRL
jgi:hypothetical protein